MLLRIGISNSLLLKDVTHVVAKSEIARVARPLWCARTASWPVTALASVSPRYLSLLALDMLALS
jgi:hypothetical protein